jgi:hypothetical protein
MTCSKTVHVKRLLSTAVFWIMTSWVPTFHLQVHATSKPKRPTRTSPQPWEPYNSQKFTGSSNYEDNSFLGIALCSLVEVDRYFRDVYWLHYQGNERPDDGGSTHLWNVGLLRRDYAALYPIRLSSSYSPSREPEISHVQNMSVNYKSNCFQLF